MRSLSHLAVLLIVAAGVYFGMQACSGPSAAHAASVKPESNRKTAPEFTLKDANGTAVHLSDYKGKVVLLDFWATWCGPCKIEIPWFMEFEQTYKDRGFAALGVSMDEDGWEAVKPFIESERINYRVVLGDEHVGMLYGGVESLPTTFLVDRDGRVATVHVGVEAGKRDFKDEIERLLGETRVAVRPAAPGAVALLARPERGFERSAR